MEEKLIEGLQTLYLKLTNQTAGTGPMPEEAKGEILSSTSLSEFFAKKQSEWKEKRMKMNSENKFLKIPRVVIMKHLLPYFEVQEICRLCEVCVTFNSIIKSNIFLSYYVALHEKTGIAINLGENLNTSFKKPKKIIDERSVKVDTEAQLEAIQKTREFLAIKLKESREQVKNLRKELHELRGILEIEKGTKEKALGKASELENQISEYKAKSQSTMIILEDNILDFDRDVFLCLKYYLA